MAKPKLTQNLLLILVGVVGLVVLSLVSPDLESAKVPPPAKVSEKDSLPLGDIGPRESGPNPFDEPFLFRLAGTDKVTGLERERILQRQYNEILRDLHGEVPEVEVQEISGMTVVSIDSIPFVTVLPSDAPEYYARLSDDKKKELERQIAERWKHLLEVDLAVESHKRSPQSLAAYPYIVALILCLALVFHALADLFSRRYLHSPGWTLKAFFWLFFLSIAAVQNPFLRPLAGPMIRGGLVPVFFFLLLFTLCSLAYKAGCRVLDNYVEAYIASSQRPKARLQQRVNTMAQGARFLLATVVTVIGVALFLGAIGVDLGNLFAGAGIAGIALGVVGKDILIDYFYGLNILVDDQFNIGDFIETPVAKGIVESFNLRTTRVRESDGGLTIVTNGRFTVIKNHSRDFAYADFRVGVAYNSDTDHCLQMILEEVRDYAQQHPEKLYPEPAYHGVQTLGDNAVILRVQVKTMALAQWEVNRELNRRVLKRFSREGVDIPFPQRTVWLKSDSLPEIARPESTGPEISLCGQSHIADDPTIQDTKSLE